MELSLYACNDRRNRQPEISILAIFHPKSFSTPTRQKALKCQSEGFLRSPGIISESENLSGVLLGVVIRLRQLAPGQLLLEHPGALSYGFAFPISTVIGNHRV